jgi:signal transduction histidine kinase
MSNRRDRMIAVAAALVVALLAGSIVTTVLSAERNGRKALESLQVAQLKQLANLLDGAVGPALTTPAGLSNPAGGAWHLTPGDPADFAGLDILQHANPTARTGNVLLNSSGVVVNGTLLTSKTMIGQSYTRPGLDKVLGGKGVLLPTATNSLTTPLPTIGIARPIRAQAAGTAGPVVGVIINESDVAPDSQITKLMKSFKRAKTDSYSFIDTENIVVASTDPSIVGRPADPVLLDPKVGFHRHGSVVTATALIPSAGWRAVYRQTRKEFEGGLTGPLRSALLLLIFVALIGAGLTFFALVSRLRAARQEQQRLAAINAAREEFISIVSHELRTPATGQLGFLQTLLDHWDALSEPERLRTVGQAYANARRLHALTRDVLDTTSIEAGELPYSFETVEVGPAVQVATDAVSAPGHVLEVHVEGEPLMVRADPERLQQVLANLLDNAIKHSPADSTIDLRVASSGGQALVEVNDRGAGITDDELKRAFEKFSRGRHASVKGSGLGLYICRKIIDAHGGRIWISRRDGGGATVSFTLPLVSTAPGEESEAGDGHEPATAPAGPAAPAETAETATR